MFDLSGKIIVPFWPNIDSAWGHRVARPGLSIIFVSCRMIAGCRLRIDFIDGDWAWVRPGCGMGPRLYFVNGDMCTRPGFGFGFGLGIDFINVYYCGWGRDGLVCGCMCYGR